MQRVEIRVQGHLDESWGDWLEGFAFIYTPRDETLLTGEVKDQAAMYGLVAKLRDLGAKLVAINSGQGISED
jgi:hypothetical protein